MIFFVIAGSSALRIVIVRTEEQTIETEFGPFRIFILYRAADRQEAPHTAKGRHAEGHTPPSYRPEKASR